MNRYGVLVVVVALNGCATSAPIATPDELATVTAGTIRAHARAVRDHVRAGREALGLRPRSGNRVVDVETAEPRRVTRATERAPDTAPAVSPARDVLQGHPARDAEAHEIRMDVTTPEMLTASGTLQPRAAQALARMARMARERGGEFTVTIPRARIETASAILAAAPEATILSTDEADGFRLVVVTEEH
jgi:hypothetical protein